MTTNLPPTTALFSFLALDPRKGPEQMPSPATTLGIEGRHGARPLGRRADGCGAR